MDEINKCIDSLIKSAVWDKLVEIAKTTGKNAATKLCSEYASPDICETVIQTIFEIGF